MLKERKIFIIRVENENIIHGIMSLYPKILGGLILKGRGVPPPPPSTSGKSNVSKILEIDSKC